MTRDPSDSPSNDLPTRWLEHGETGERVGLALEGPRVHEHRGEATTTTVHRSVVRAFVALSNRARALEARGFACVPRPRIDAVDEEPSVVGSWADFEAYVGRVDLRRSLPAQELRVASALTRSVVRGEPRFGDALAIFTLLEWPHAFDVEPEIEKLREPEVFLFATLEAELAADPSAYPKELVRIASHHASPRVIDLALHALQRTRDEDAWMDVLIEGEDAMEARHASVLGRLAASAPSPAVKKLLADIAKDLRSARR